MTRGTEPGDWRRGPRPGLAADAHVGTTQLGPVTRPLRVRVRHRSGEHSALLAPPGTALSPAVVDDPAAVRRLTAARRGELELMDRVPVATAYTLTEDTFTVQVHSSLPLDGLTPVLGTPITRSSGPSPAPDHGGVELTFPLTGSRFGYDGLALPKGRYAVTLAGEDRQQDLPVTPSPRPPRPAAGRGADDPDPRTGRGVPPEAAGAHAQRAGAPGRRREGAAEPVPPPRGGAGRGGHPGQRVLPLALQRGHQLQHARRPPRAGPPRVVADPLLVRPRPQRPRARGRGRPDRRHSRRGTRRWPPRAT